MLWPYLSSLLLVGGCRCDADRGPPAPSPAIEVRDEAGAVTARVVPGRPCRAAVDGLELLVGGRPLVAQHGAARWSGEDAANGTTLRKDGVAVARVHARQLFDAEGLPVLRVADDGSIAGRTGAAARRATASAGANAVRIGALTVTGTIDVMLAAVLTAPEVAPELRAIVACHLLLPEAR